MNQTLRNIAERYSCRDFSGSPPTDEQISNLVDAALAAPSARNLQPWHIVVIKDKAIIEELDDAGMKILAADEDKTAYDLFMERGGKLFYNVPCMFVILHDGSSWGMLDSGILGQNIVLAAESLGLGTCYLGMASVPLRGPRKDEFAQRLKFPEGYEFAVGIAIGAVKSGKAPHEPDSSKVTYIG